jgi:hypothetical protein
MKPIAVIAMVCVLLSCASAQQFETKMELELDQLTGIAQLDNSDGTSVAVAIHNATDGSVVVSRYAAAGIYLPNMTIVMQGEKFNLSYNTLYTYNLSTVYGDFLYNFTTPVYRIDTSDANATASQMLSGYTAYVDGSKLSGSIITRTLSALTTTVLAGYYSATDLATVDTDLTSANIKSGATIFGISGNVNVVNTSSGNATASQILANQVAWVDGSEVTGTMPTQTLSSGSVNVAAGYYEATTLNATDSDLAAANIASGVNIFGIEGSLSGGGVELHSGQTGCWDGSGNSRTCSGTGEDADIDGTAKSFTDNGDGTVTDDHTGIMWTEADNGATVTWQAALDYCNALTTAGHTDWHLPTAVEAITLIDYGPGGFKNSAFTWSGDYYWTSTSHPSFPDYAYYAGFVGGGLYVDGKRYDDSYMARCSRSA